MVSLSSLRFYGNLRLFSIPERIRNIRDAERVVATMKSGGIGSVSATATVHEFWIASGFSAGVAAYLENKGIDSMPYTEEDFGSMSSDSMGQARNAWIAGWISARDGHVEVVYVLNLDDGEW